MIMVLALIVLASAAVSDLREREAPNRAWIALFALGVAGLWLHDVGLAQLIGLGIVVSFVAFVSITAFLRQWIGGADAKAAMVLPVAFPRLPNREVADGVFGAFTQGFEVLMLVCIVAGLVGLAWQYRLDEEANRGVPFLVAIFAGALAVVALPV